MDTFNAPFPAKITAATDVSGTWTYDWTEQSINPSTGELQDATPARTGDTDNNPAYELNNTEVAVDTIVTMRLRGYAANQLIYEFAAPDGTSSGGGGSGTTTIDGYTYITSETLSTWASDQHDLADPSTPGSESTLYRVSASTPVQLTGMVPADDDQFLYLLNVGSKVIYLMTENAGSTAANRFTLPGGADLALLPGDGAACWYDTTSTRWKILSTSASDTAVVVLTSTTKDGNGNYPAVVQTYVASTDTWSNYATVKVRNATGRNLPDNERLQARHRGYTSGGDPLYVYEGFGFATSTNAGVLSTGTQSIGGYKSFVDDLFSDRVQLAEVNLSGGPYGSVEATAYGSKLVGGVYATSPASGNRDLTLEIRGSYSATDPTSQAAGILLTTNDASKPTLEISDGVSTANGLDGVQGDYTFVAGFAVDYSPGGVPSHNHDASDITSGTMATARLGSGTANNTVFLRGDQTWASVDTAQIANNAITNALLRDGGACSVIGVSANSGGDPADISASTNGTFLGRRGDVLGFYSPKGHELTVTGAIYRSTANQTISDITQTILLTGSTTLDLDTDSFTSGATSGYLKIPTGLGGWYIVGYGVVWNTITANGLVGSQLIDNSGNVYALSRGLTSSTISTTHGQTGVALIYLAAGDEIAIRVFQNTGGNQTVLASSGQSAILFLYKVGN